MLTIVPYRSIGPFVAQATLEERHDDEMTITRHPVEQGAAITDHSFKEPAFVHITAGWSNSDPANTGASGLFGGIASLFGTGGSEFYVMDLYRDFLLLQEDGSPFSIVTGKRVYDNMLIRSLRTETTEATETSLVLHVVCQQIIIVETSTILVAPASAQKFPEKNQPQVNTGPKQLQVLPPGAVPPT